ncbi:hypothetical protein GCM10010411_75260 [Actinomadura fulvescens]|uniref:Uncharacterized protein n=1 Tax=Actinomadura fulvescens TaxID=46160 RepID=A0ABN3QI75_9ACTN
MAAAAGAPLLRPDSALPYTLTLAEADALIRFAAAFLAGVSPATDTADNTGATDNTGAVVDWGPLPGDRHASAGVSRLRRLRPHAPRR